MKMAFPKANSKFYPPCGICTDTKPEAVTGIFIRFKIWSVLPANTTVSSSIKLTRNTIIHKDRQPIPNLCLVSFNKPKPHTFSSVGHLFQPFRLVIPMYCYRCGDVCFAELLEPVHILRPNDVAAFKAGPLNRPGTICVTLCP